MAEIVLFHHAQGLTPGMHAFADHLRADGHTVHLPDLFDGLTFPDVESGVTHASGIGFDVIAARGVAAAELLPAAVVYVGFSMGVMPAQQLAQTRKGAVGAIFIDACLPAEEFGEWPADLPVQIHGGSDDSWFDEDLESARAVAGSQPNAALFLYGRTEHLFADSSLNAYQPEAAALLLDRVRTFLAGLT